MSHPNVLILIPCYNRSHVLMLVLKQLKALNYDVLLIDDGSTSPLSDEIKMLANYFLKHDVNMGQGASLTTAMAYASNLKYDFFVHFDSDGQHDVNDIERFCSLLTAENLDIALGSRFKSPSTSKLVPLKKRIILKTARFVNFIFTGVLLSDAHNGFRVLNKKAVSTVRFKQARMAHATELLSILKHQGLKYKEFSNTVYYPDYSPVSDRSFLSGLKVIYELIVKR